MFGRRTRRHKSCGRFAAMAALIGGLAWTSTAAAADDERGRPWAKGTVVPSVGLGFGYSSDLVSLSFGLGASYYVVNGLSLGLQLNDQVLIYSKSLKSDFPEIENQIPTNVFRLTPVAQWVFLRRPRFSPYVFGGVGPAFFNNDNGTFGSWTAGPGAYIGLGGPVSLDLGVSFSGLFPADRCNEAFEYEPQTGPNIGILDYCSIRWSPRLGLVFAFGGSKRDREREQRREPAPDPFLEPAANPMPESAPEEPLEPAPEPLQPAEPELAPSEPPPPEAAGPAPAPPADAPVSVDPPAEVAPAAAPPADAPTSGDAPAPAAAPGT